MKKVLYGFGLVLLAALAISCSVPVLDSVTGVTDGINEKGTLSIVWGNSSPSARSFVTTDEMSSLSYEINLTGPGDGEPITETVGVGDSLDKTFAVTPGLWTITIKGYKPAAAAAGETLRLMGIEQVMVEAGKSNSKAVGMYTAAEVDIDQENWEDSFWAAIESENNTGFNQTKSDGSSWTREELIILKGTEDKELVLTRNGDAMIIRPIILIAEVNVTIKRYTDLTESIHYSPFFEVTSGEEISGGRLTLGKPGMTGGIIFDGTVDDGDSSESLMRVYEGGELIINDTVTIKNGYTKDGGGVYVAAGGKLTMEGGSITGNTATSKGGGVYVEYDGDYEKNGGDISGNSFQNGTGENVTGGNEDPNVYEQPPVLIDEQYWKYLENNDNAKVEGLINSWNYYIIQGTITFTENTITVTPPDTSTEEPKTIFTVSTAGENRDFEYTESTNNKTYSGEWAYLYENSTKIGVIFWKTEQGSAEKYTEYYLGDNAVTFLQENTYNIDASDYDDIAKSYYNGSGKTIYTGDLILEPELR